MAKARSLVGLAVHASKVVAAMLGAETGELRFGRLAGETDRTLALCSELPWPVRCAYEAGPTGFGLARALSAAGVERVVAAPGKIPRAAQDRVKTDRRDAEHLVRLLLAGKLEAVRVPTSEEEALRDLVRAREDVRGDLMRARHSNCGLDRSHRLTLDHPSKVTQGSPLLTTDCAPDGSIDCRTNYAEPWLEAVADRESGPLTTWGHIEHHREIGGSRQAFPFMHLSPLMLELRHAPLG